MASEHTSLCGARVFSSPPPLPVPPHTSPVRDPATRRSGGLSESLVGLARELAGVPMRRAMQVPSPPLVCTQCMRVHVHVRAYVCVCVYVCLFACLRLSVSSKL
jgi:hypothetical protein